MAQTTTVSQGSGMQGATREIPEAIRSVFARLDRLHVWSMPWGFIPIIGLGFLFTFFDIFDFNVSFVQTCNQLVAGCTPATTAHFIGLPAGLNMLGYVLGALILSPLADRFGRRDMLLVTMLVTGLGSLYTALSPDMVNFTISRFVTGFGIGADLALVNVYVTEVAPKESRAKFASIIFIMSAIGAILGVWLALILTLPAGHWPEGLPISIGTFPGSQWRWIYGIGAVLAVVAIVLRYQLPESVRWLLHKGRTARAEEITAGMEDRARAHGASLAAVDLAAVPTHWPVARRSPYADLFMSPLYRTRLAILSAAVFFGYITVYAYAVGLTVILSALGYSAPVAGMITAVGVFGFLVDAVMMSFIVEKLDRRHWFPVATVVLFIGTLILGLGGRDAIWLAFIGALVIFLGNNIWLTPLYALLSECFPTRARTSGYGFVDGFSGHIGAAISTGVIVPFLVVLPALGALLIIPCFMIVSSIVVQFAPRTRNRVFEEISP